MTLGIVVEVVVGHFHCAGKEVMNEEAKMRAAMRLGARNSLFDYGYAPALGAC